MAKTFRKQIDDKKYNDGQTTAREMKRKVESEFCQCKSPYAETDGYVEWCNFCGKEL